MLVYMDMILPAIPITLSSYIHTHTLTHHNKQHIYVYSFPFPLPQVGWITPVEMELLSAIAFEDDVLTQQEQQTELMDDTTTIPDSAAFQ